MLHRFKMLQIVLTIYLLLPSLISVHGFLGNECNIYDLRSKQCDESEICVEGTSSCQCAPGYKNVENSCVKIEINGQPVPTKNPESEDNQSGSLVTGILMFIFIVVTIVVVIYVLNRYNAAHWIRNKVNSFRQSHYDEFMIGQDVDDDPPLR